MMRKLKPLSSIRRRGRGGRRRGKRSERPVRNIGPGREPMHANAGVAPRGPGLLRRRNQEDAEVGELEPLEEGGRAGRFGPLARLGEHLRIQAEQGYRAAIIELRPGLFLVGEVSSTALEMQPEFGVAFLAPMMANAAVKVLSDPKGTQQTLSQVSQGASAAAKFLVEPPKPQQPQPMPQMAVQLVARPQPVPPQAPMQTPMQAYQPMPVQVAVVPQPAPQVAGWIQGWAPPPQVAGWQPATWVTEADISGESGCDGCPGRCGGGYRRRS